MRRGCIARGSPCPLLKSALALSYSERTKGGGGQLPLSVTELNSEPLLHALCTGHSSGFSDPEMVPPAFVGCLVTLEALITHQGAVLSGRLGHGVGGSVDFPPSPPAFCSASQRNHVIAIWPLGSAHRDAARPQECAHYRKLDDCPDRDGGGRAGVLPL